MSKDSSIKRAVAALDNKDFFNLLSRRVALQTESQNQDKSDTLVHYLCNEIGPNLSELGFVWEIIDNPRSKNSPFLLAERIERPDAITVLTYAHGDVVGGQHTLWQTGLSPWTLTESDGKFYGRGVADNKGQHTINLIALASVLAERNNQLGFNLKIVFEMGEEMGSPGLNEIGQQYADRLHADVFIASDGPRLSAHQPTLFLGSRGILNFDLLLNPRQGGRHSGNWGGILSNPGIRLANALSILVDATGNIRLLELLPDSIPVSVHNALSEVDISIPEQDDNVPQWGNQSITPAERLYAWNTLEVLAFTAGNPDLPANAIPDSARAHCQIRYVAGSHPEQFLSAIRAHLDQHGFYDVDIRDTNVHMNATRLDPDHPWVKWVANSVKNTTGHPPVILPNIGGSLPNDVFAQTLNLPTIWIPHSYPHCSQHAPNEHLPVEMIRQSLAIMSGLFWDLGEYPSFSV